MFGSTIHFLHNVSFSRKIATDTSTGLVDLKHLDKEPSSTVELARRLWLETSTMESTQELPPRTRAHHIKLRVQRSISNSIVLLVF